MTITGNTHHTVDIAIIGGGVAGLWILNRLCQAGYHAVLLEKKALGAGQTLASQGIIHGGLKYALNGVLNPASSAIADMPARWRQCLEGRGDIDLRQTRLLSDHYSMWSSGSMRSRLKTFLGSKALRGRIEAQAEKDYPAFFKSAPDRLRGTLYRLPDFVVDTPSLLRNLASPWQRCIFRCDDIALQPQQNDSEHYCLALNPVSGQHYLQAQQIILCAGEGNEQLLAGSEHEVSAINGPAMQRRPLHMVAVRMPYPNPAYVHCIGNSFGMTPRLTITAHPCRDGENGEWIWYLGGELAESGITLSATAQISRAHTELKSLFPWIPLPEVNVHGKEHPCWHSFLINRAEPRAPDLTRPDQAFVEQCGNVLVCWPTKLTLSPNLGDTVLSRLNTLPETCSPAEMEASLAWLNDRLPPAEIASAPWEHLR